jgi:hypothetical protein
VRCHGAMRRALGERLEALRRQAVSQSREILGQGACFYSLEVDSPARVDFFRDTSNPLASIYSVVKRFKPTEIEILIIDGVRSYRGIGLRKNEGGSGIISRDVVRRGIGIMDSRGKKKSFWREIRIAPTCTRRWSGNRKEAKTQGERSHDLHQMPAR